MAIGKYFKDLTATTDIDGLLGVGEKADGSPPGNKFVYSKTPDLVTPSDAKVLTEGAVVGITEYSGTTTVTVGGITAGTTLTNDAVNDVLDKILRPYIHPTFTAFAISGQTTKEVGDLISGVQTFTWTISDPTHAQPNSITISDEILPQTLIIGHSIVSPATYDFSTLPGGGVTLTSPGTYTWKVKSIDTGTPPTIFERFFNLQWMWLTHWGANINASLTNAQILALAGSQLRTTFPPQVSFAGGSTYFWYWVPSSFTQPTIFKDHATGFAIGMEAAVTQSVTNVNGVATNYKGYRSTNTLVSALTIDVS